jgi:hypothetical protein
MKETDRKQKKEKKKRKRKEKEKGRKGGGGNLEEEAGTVATNIYVAPWPIP